MNGKCASKTLFVGNLHASLEESDLLEIFKPFGKIVECCKRWYHYGFVQFATEEEAQLAFNNLNGSKMKNIQALIEAEADAKLSLLSKLDLSSTLNMLAFSLDNLNQHPLLSILSTSKATEMSFARSQSDSNKSKTINECFIESSISKLFDDLMDDQRENNENESPVTLNNISESRIENTRSETSKRAFQVLSSNSQNMSKQWHGSESSEAISFKPSNKVLFSLSDCSSPASPRSFSPFPTKSNDNSVMLFRSINSSHTICVEPTDVLQPLNEGDFAEYKLFPSSENSGSKSPKSSRLEAFCSIFNNRVNKDCDELEIELLGDYTPQSLSISGSSQNSSNSNSPNFFRF